TSCVGCSASETSSCAGPPERARSPHAATNIVTSTSPSNPPARSQVARRANIRERPEHMISPAGVAETKQRGGSRSSVPERVEQRRVAPGFDECEDLLACRAEARAAERRDEATDELRCMRPFAGRAPRRTEQAQAALAIDEGAEGLGPARRGQHHAARPTERRLTIGQRDGEDL